jgi:UDP-3-O-[3-hydroxymyristoyl] glucosamine N-acyltransferase
MSEPGRPTVRLGDVAEAVGGELDGGADVTIGGVAALAEAGPDDLAFVDAEHLAPAALASRAGAFLVRRRIAGLDRPQLVVGNPRYALGRIVERFFRRPVRPPGVAAPVALGRDVVLGADVCIWPFVTLGDRVRVGARVTLYPGVFVGDDAEIGDDTVLYPNVTVGARCVLGHRVIVHGATVIGSDGFGYVEHEGRHHKIPQLGIVVIEDDVELGAGVTVDRATFGRTVIARGTKIDNLVQVAHNVTIGEDSIVVAQVGIAGSTRLGPRVVVGGQAGIADHVEVGERAMIAAQSGVDRSVGAGEVVSGSPAMPHALSLRVHALLRRLPELRAQVRALERRLAALESAAPRRRKRS